MILEGKLPLLLGRDGLPFLVTHPRGVSSQQKVIVDRKRGQSFPSAASFPGTKTATKDKKLWGGHLLSGLENTPTPTHATTYLLGTSYAT
jgi:hypothetical protein